MIKKLFNKKESTQKKREPSSTKNTNSTQQWIPIIDVTNHLLYRNDKTVVAAIRVQPLNIHLLSDKEKHLKITSLNEVFNGIDYDFQIFSIARPVDLDSYILRLENMKIEEGNFIKKRLLEGYIQQAAQLVTAGEALERQFFVLLSKRLGKKSDQDQNELLQKAIELAGNLSGASLPSHLCTDQEWRDVLFIFSNPTQAAYERAPNQSNDVLQAIYQGG